MALLDRRHAAALRKGFICAFVVLGLSACGQAKPLGEVELVDEIPPGPGLFTGKDGKYIIYGKGYVE
ncbi:MAG: hypothetical protein IIA00_08510 [Proteobacteria bacterium]|nr:hypothetical protein [Pseudomonadota bacterium]